MGKIKLLIDFGSTFTKVVAMDLDQEKVMATARAPSTVDTDVTIGLEQALQQISETFKIGNTERMEALACSSAAGGLRMVCVGFVPDLTSKAAHHAALGAGAKVVGLYSYKLTRQEILEIETIAPDIVLLSGGTDGGDEQVIIHNAGLLSRSGMGGNVIVAGNKSSYDEVRDIFKNNPVPVIFTKNVMPEIGVLDVGPCNREIRELFMKNIIKAKGIDKAQAIIRDVIMPTPSAVLEAARLLAEGSGNVPGMGELIVADPGGATTDIHSIARGNPAKAGVTLANSLPEPFIKRTVEGNLGLKHNIETLKKLAEGIEDFRDLESIVRRFFEGKLPESKEEIDCHILLSRVAVEEAMDHHAGRIDVVYGPMGEILIQRGKDLTGIKTIIGTGGPIIDSSNPQKVLEGVLFRNEKSFILKPIDPRFYLDKDYILFAVGLLSQVEPEKALKIAKKHLKEIG